MPEDKKIIEFPNVHQKLQAPTKQSVFERQKQEAEAKRLREEAETAAVYKDFVASFDDDDIPESFGRDRGGAPYGTPTGPPRRHFGGGLPPNGPAGRGGFNGRGNSGPGSLSSGPGSLGPPPNSLNRKRTHDGFAAEAPGRKRDNDRLAFDDYDGGHQTAKKAFNASDDEDERHGGRHAEPPVPKPTIRLANLPPGTSPAVIKALIPETLTVDAVRIIPQSGPTTAGERKSMSAIVTMAKDTAANDIDAAVNTLQNTYLGYGFYLTLHRHLSSAALSSITTGSSNTGTSSHPFGAKPAQIDQGPSQNHAPQGQRGFAPPTSYAPGGPGMARSQQPLLYVAVEAPRDIKELKLIHKTIESMLTHGPEFEALLMSRPEVQREEKWAWLWDSRSVGGVWYRWRLWQVLTGSETRKGQGKYLPLFEDSSAWKSPDLPLPFEYTNHLDEFVSDSEYNSSDQDDSGDEGPRKPTNRGGGMPDTSILNNEDGIAYLNPLEKAKLTHLLARLPKSTGQLRKGDVARITAFAISHAGRGADEVVHAIISNVEKPFAYTSANPSRKQDEKKDSGDDNNAAGEVGEDEDTSSAKLIGLYIISDILSSSSTSGVRHAWRYRQLFETALRNRKVFEGLGRLERKMHWGKLRAEKWKRSVGNVLGLWEGWCVFPQDAQDKFTAVFNEPPMTQAEAEEAKGVEKSMEVKAKSKWKSVEDRESATPIELPISEPKDDNLDGMAIDEDEDVDGEPMEEDDVDGVPMSSDEDDGEPMDADEPIQQETEKEPAAAERPSSPPPTRPIHRRPRAVDMFADSGSDED